VDDAGNTKESISGAVSVKVLQSTSPLESTSHSPTALSYSWAELSEIAKMISNNPSITSSTAEVSVTCDGETKTLGVGDTATVDSKTVRILGFNHDTLTTSTDYGSETATGRAGISFEYVTFLATLSMGGSNKDGWGKCTLRTTLMGSGYYGSLSIKDYIKQVDKKYIAKYNSATLSTSSDYLWLLSCGEIWDNGYSGSNTRGRACACEGSQYKYYAQNLGSTSYSSSSTWTTKANTWFLRSPSYEEVYNYCGVSTNGVSSYYSAGCKMGIAPGFCV
jgi:hypothetical protein